MPPTTLNSEEPVKVLKCQILIPQKNPSLRIRKGKR